MPENEIKTGDKVDTGDINAKEKQLLVISQILKPLFKAEGYRTSGNKWWKINGIYFNLIELQNFSWNSRNSVDFCFNFTTGFVKDIENPNRPKIYDGLSYVRESYFKVARDEYWNGHNGYHIDEATDITKFSDRLSNDFKGIIIPKFSSLTDKETICDFYTDEFWGPRVKQSLELGRKEVYLNN